ncbi:MAG: 16S rRNA (cytosine(967)-C(5))-methyltransferase RsmB [Blastocatellia bacterium]
MRNRETVSPARRAAFDILLRVDSERAYASVLIADLSRSDLLREDRGLVQEIVLGVLRWQRSLDYFVERYAERAIERLDPQVLIALRMGLYQLRHLTRIPQSAAVSESVKLVKRARLSSAAGMVNAVLRNAARHLDETAGQTISDALERMSVQLSHPRWMLERWRSAFGEQDTRDLALANNSPSSTAFRVNTLRASTADVLADLDAANVKTRESNIAKGAFVVETGLASVIMEAVRRGAIYVQDEASQLVSILLDPKPGHRVLDLCAAPGSKTSHIAALSDDQATIIASDLHPHRLITLRAACQRLGIESVAAVAMDATRELPFRHHADKFDRVLVDAPCTGTGTLRSNPEIKWRLLFDDLTRLAELQLRLLERAASVVAKDGRLVYSTCSMEREENEDVVRRFLESTNRFRLIRPVAPTDLITGDGFVRTFPHKHRSDGFFAAVLESR